MSNTPSSNAGDLTIYKDDNYVKLSGDKEQIRTCTSLYLSPLETMGALHLFYEIFNNAIDECMKNDIRPPKKIFVTFCEDTNKFTVTDEGRGIPMDILINVVTEKHFSTKFAKMGDRAKGQPGMYGVGMTVTVFLTDYMSVTTHRGNQSKTIEFIDGELVEYPVKTSKKEMHGLSVTMIPSEKYLGPIALTYDMVEDYLRNLSYIMPDYIETNYCREDKDGKYSNHIRYKSEGLNACTKFLSTSLEFNPMHIRTESEKFDLEMSFSYDKTTTDTITQSFANMVITREGGNHEIACQRAVCDYFTREAKKLDPKNKYEVVYDDCRRGLVMTINCDHIAPLLEGNAKSKLTNPDVLKEGKSLLQAQLGKVMQSDPAQLRRIIGYLRQISRIRLESNRIKGISVKKQTTFLDDSEIPKFYSISNRNSKGYRELYIAEGDSAAIALLGCRNEAYQAVLGLRGVTDNVHGLSLADVNKTDIFKNLLTVLGCGCGSEFNIANLKYNKIIICTDSDIDGSNITSLLLCFFLLFLPDLIRNGKVYKALPPLYSLNDDSLRKVQKSLKSKYMYDKKEYYALIDSIVADNVELALEDADGKILPLNKRETLHFLDVNSEYDLELTTLSKKSSCEPVILEPVVYYKLISRGDDVKFQELILKHFPEMTYNLATKSLNGSYNEDFFSLICDSIFMHNAQRFMMVMKENLSMYIHYRNKNDEEDRYDRCTIGTFLSTIKLAYTIKIDNRYKGLGDATADILFATTTNPKLRKLLRITMRDAKEALKTFDLIHGKKPQMIVARRDYLDSLTISYADIDN